MARLERADRKAERRAVRLAQQAKQLLDQGKFAAALPPNAEALGIVQARAAADPERRTLHDGMAAAMLHNRSAMLAGTGQLDAAVAASQEAVEINRRQIELVPGDLPLLAAALSRYARQLGAVGRASDALAASQETLATYRRLTLADPARARAPLAEALVDCARLLRQARLEAEAFPLTREAVALYQQLGPATHPSYAAEAAHEMAVALARRQLWAEAVPLDEQAIGIYRRLGLAGGERFGALLGEATTAFIVHLAALGPDGEDYQRQLQQRDPVLCLQLDVLGQALASSPEILAEARARFGGRPR